MSGSSNWVVQNLENALETWNSKLAEIWTLITQSPETFKGGTIWDVILKINGAVQAIGLALLVLFFVVGIIRTCGSLTEVKKPEHAFKLFIRFATFTSTSSTTRFNYNIFTTINTLNKFFSTKFLNFFLSTFKAFTTD